MKDTTGAVLPGASVSIRNIDTGLSRELVSDSNGRYAAPDLPPGPYEVTAALTGFGTVARSGIALTVGRAIVIDLVLSLGTIADRVEVVGEASPVDTRSASTGALIGDEQIRGLPLNGRSYIELATLSPGVQLSDTASRGTGGLGYGLKLSVHGSRFTANHFSLDGTTINDQFGSAGSTAGTVMGVDAIREFQVITNSFSAEYGNHTGAVISAATKSGTNNFRGSAFEFHRNDALDARNFFDPPDASPDFRRNQFGVSLGGPLRRDSTFFFATYEGMIERLGETAIFTVPAEQVRRGAVDPRVRPFLESYPLPNGRLFGTTGEFIEARTRDTDEHYLALRLDQQLSQGANLFARYTTQDTQVVDPGALHASAINKSRSQYLTVEHTAVRGSSLVNTLQFGYVRNRTDAFDDVLPGITLPRVSFTDLTLLGVAAINVTGLSPYGGDSSLPKFHLYQNFQIKDTVAWTRGRHSLRMGAVGQFLHFNLVSNATGLGLWQFNSLEDFLSAKPQQFSAMIAGSSDVSRRLRQAVFGFFAQDDFQIRSNLTINLGLRYEPTTNVTEVDGKLAQLIDFANPSATLRDTTVVDKLFENPSRRNLAPRIGFAWDVFGNAKTAVRGGAGLFHDLVTVSYPIVQNTAVRVPPFHLRGGLVATSTQQIDFPEAYFTQQQLLAAQAAMEGVQFDPAQPQMLKWNINIQRELFERTTLELGYSGTRGYNLYRQIHTNGRDVQRDADGRWFTTANTPLRQSNFQRMRYRPTDGDSWYHGATIGLSRRGHRLQTQVSYTYSKNIDTGSGILDEGEFAGSGGSRFPLFNKDKGLSGFDVRHFFVANVNLALPFGQSPGLLNALARAWEVSGLVRLRSGYPFSVSTGIDRELQVFGPRYPDLRPGASNNPVLGGADQYFDPTAFLLPPVGYIGNLGRNTLIGPGAATVDLLVSREVRLSGAGPSLQLRLEIFNLLNRANLGVPARQLFTASGQYRQDAGRITSTSTTARQLQVGVKLVW